MPVERISQPAGLPDPPSYSGVAAYSHVVKVTNPRSIVFLTGQVAHDERGEVVGGSDFRAQATQAFENFKKALAGAGADFSDLVKITIYITDQRYRQTLGEVRNKYITEAFPTSTLVVAQLAHPELLVEIEGIAVIA
jgi:enamine deaminase RidA (YjgF/YER057c/UK114 family)